MTSWTSSAEGAGVTAVPGLRLGDRYELVSPIAAGGMAQVWKARDLVLNRDVAAKILHPHLTTDDAFVARFRREAVAAAQLSHRSIVSVYDTITTPLEAIVMELIDGGTLRARLDEAGALSAREVIDLGVQISGALHEAHTAGIVHRDIKPANIMIGSDKRVMVTDFGIAKAGTDADLTTTGTLLGTAKYLSPEQVTGDPIDPRSDLYSLGIVLFESLTGTVPFKAGTDAATALARLHQDPPPVRQLRPNAPVDLAAVVTRLMARDPRERFSRSLQVRDALLAIDPDAPPGPTPNQGAAMAGVTGGWNPANLSPDPGGNGRPRPPDPPANLRQGPPLHQVITFNPGSGPVEVGGLPAGGQPVGGGVVSVSSESVRRSGRSRLTTLLVLALVLGALAVVGALLLGLNDDPPVNAESTPLTIASATSFDPLSSDAVKDENEELTGLAIDRDLATAWATVNYNGANLAGLKDGVGLKLTLGEASPVSRIELDANSEGWAADIFVGDEFGDDPTQWVAPAVTITGGSRRMVRDLAEPIEGSMVLIWIRDTGLTGERFRFELAEVVVK